MKSRRQSIASLAAAAGLLLMMMMSGWAGASQAQSYAVQPEESAFWIDGQATTGPFTCQAPQVEGRGTLRAAGAGRSAEALVLIPVRGFECGNRRMNADLYDALDAKDHPFIRFELAEAEALRLRADSAGRNSLRVTGYLMLAGTRKPVEVHVRWWRSAEGQVRAYGEKALRMSDFGIEPPTALLGLIKARDRITVRFELAAARTSVGRASGGP